jgi:hypothetical protein
MALSKRHSSPDSETARMAVLRSPWDDRRNGKPPGRSEANARLENPPIDVLCVLLFKILERRGLATYGRFGLNSADRMSAGRQLSE